MIFLYIGQLETRMPKSAMFFDHQNEIRKFYQGPSKHYLCKIWLQLANYFQRKRLQCDKFTDEER
jgi:hypothetical protein